jgi:hypothetical protein
LIQGKKKESHTSLFIKARELGGMPPPSTIQGDSGFPMVDRGACVSDDVITSYSFAWIHPQPTKALAFGFWSGSVSWLPSLQKIVPPYHNCKQILLISVTMTWMKEIKYQEKETGSMGSAQTR